jgi:D-glycero-alpha-D-manno-heptose-7-phosphate kinase
MKSVTAQAPTRVDLAGGTLDLWPLHCLLDHKTTVNVAIGLDATVTVESSGSKNFEFVSLDQSQSQSGSYSELCKSRELALFSLLLSFYWNEKLPPIKITSRATSPAGAGLGGSSCLAVTMGAALWKTRQQFEDLPDLGERKLVQISQDIEARLISSPTGCQDYWGAVRGGVNVIEFPYGGVEVTTMDSETIGSLVGSQMVVCYSGKSRQSAINNWEIYKRFFDGDQQIIKNFNQIGKLAENCASALKNNDLESALAHSKAEWSLRCELWPAIETVETKAINRAAIEAGANFSRVCGAGGGGVMAIFTDQKHRDEVCESVTKAGGEVLPAQVATQGLRVDTF